MKLIEIRIIDLVMLMLNAAVLGAVALSLAL